MIVEPKPRRTGGATGGPSSSRQRSEQQSFSSIVHSTSTAPRESDRAPYLAELVTISWNTSARVENAFGVDEDLGTGQADAAGLAADIGFDLGLDDVLRLCAA